MRLRECREGGREIGVPTKNQDLSRIWNTRFSSFLINFLIVTIAYSVLAQLSNEFVISCTFPTATGIFSLVLNTLRGPANHLSEQAKEVATCRRNLWLIINSVLC